MAFHKSEPHQTFAHSTLHADASQGNKDALLSSLDAGAAIDEMDGSRMTPLMHAAKNGHLDCVRLLIGRGADVYKMSDSCLLAAQGGHTEVLLTLFDAGVAVDVTSSFSQMTPLMCACLKGHKQCVVSLLGHGADVHKEERDGTTAAHFAALGGKREVLLAILDAGAVVDVTDANLMTPIAI